jgi:hypothetical protein
MTKADLIEKGKALGVKLTNKMLKAEMEKAIKTAEKPKKTTAVKTGYRNEY